jgi:hypothetical protein
MENQDTRARSFNLVSTNLFKETRNKAIIENL